MRRTITFFLIITFLLTIVLSAINSRPVAHAQGPVQARVTTDSLAIRLRPGVNASPLGLIPLNAVVNITGREDQQGNGGVWVYGSPESGSPTGWMLSDYLQFGHDFVMENLPVLTVEGAAPTSGGTNTTPSNPSNPPASAPAGGLNGTTTGVVNFRSAPSTSAGVIAGLGANTSVVLTGRNGDSTWLQAVYNGQTGWLFASLVQVSGDKNSLAVVPGTEVAAAPATTSGGGNTGTGNPPAPAAYSSANLRVFSYGAHVSSFAFPDLMHYAGMTWAKVQIRYGRGQDPNSVAGTINDAHAKGFRILLGVVGYPADIGGGDAYFNDYAKFVGGLAGLGADAIEIWNEPNIDREWPTGQIDPARYTQLLAKAYNAIKGTNAGTIVISAAPSPTGAESAFGRDRVWNDNNYIAGLAAAGAARYMDCVGAHYNEGIVSPRQTSGDPRDNYYTRYFYGMVNTYYSAIRKPVCFTELGYLTPEGYGPLPGAFGWAANTTAAQQGQWVADAIRLARSSGKVPLVIIWNMDFTGTFGDDPMGGYALIRPDGSCPACDRLAGR
ncbi:MAG: SH3 domain-containing protein [Chloroflexi bacterium]|nr:SH3 domain-containing protein [Chloroflexota bacterium]